jgi:hypothetical protein
MTNTSTTSPALQSEAGTVVHLLDNWLDAIEVELRERVREFIQAMSSRRRWLARATAAAQQRMSRMVMGRKVSLATATVTARDH